jgi:hypothetical protein
VERLFASYYFLYVVYFSNCRKKPALAAISGRPMSL